MSPIEARDLTKRFGQVVAADQGGEGEVGEDQGGQPLEQRRVAHDLAAVGGSLENGGQLVHDRRDDLPAQRGAEIRGSGAVRRGCRGAPTRPEWLPQSAFFPLESCAHTVIAARRPTPPVP